MSQSMGLMYWYFLYPLHKVIFKGMIRTMVQHIEDTYDQLKA